MTILHGNCIELLAELPPDSFDACITDPPYHLSEVPHVSRIRFGGKRDDERRTARAGFMGKAWDGGDIAQDPDTWRAIHRTLKPGAYLVAFGGTRTFAEMFVAIKAAGFEYRDTIAWLYGSGFPKGKACLKPAWEPIGLFRKPGASTHLQIDAGRIATDEKLTGGGSPIMRYDGQNDRPCWGEGYERTPTQGNTAGRWPANVAHDGSAEVEAAFAAFGNAGGGYGVRGKATRNALSDTLNADTGQTVGFGDTGTASRFYYCAKASKADRAGSKHPTIKPINLIRWLVRLITPPGGHILDPFAGSGTTAQAAHQESRQYTLIEQQAEYIEDIQRRVDTMQTPDMFLASDLLQSFDVFRTTRPDLTDPDALWDAYRAYSLDLAHPKFAVRHSKKRRNRHPKPLQLDLFAA